MGQWSGSPINGAPPAAGLGDWAAFQRLQGDARLAVLTHEFGGLLRVDQTGGDIRLLANGAPFLTLTPPSIADLEKQLIHVRNAADLRAERLNEIVMQMDDMLSFFGSQYRMHPATHRWTYLLLQAAYQCVLVPEMRAKFFASLPRPMEFSPQAQPVIQTPAHSTWPSGHATEAFMFASIIAMLRIAARGNATGPTTSTPSADPAGDLLNDLLQPNAPTRPEMIPFRLAARIADNRTIAGVHFPVDSASGALLGLSAAIAFAAACDTTGPTRNTFTADARTWTTPFTLDLWCGGLAGTIDPATVIFPAASATGIPAQLWTAAIAEWT